MQIKYLFFSKRLAFREWLSSDTPKYAALSSDPEVMKFFPKEYWLDHVAAQKSIAGMNAHFNQYGFTFFAVDLIETGTFIGFIGMKKVTFDSFFTPAVDIGWRLDRKFWGNGYATEGAIACRDWFFKNFQTSRLVSMTTIQNTASENVMRKIGMKKVGYFAHPLLEPEDPLSEHVLYEIKAPIKKSPDFSGDSR